MNYHSIKKGLLNYPDVTEYSNNVTKYNNAGNKFAQPNHDKFVNLPIDYMKNFHIKGQNYDKKSGPNAIRTRDPRHVKAVS